MKTLLTVLVVSGFLVACGDETEGRSYLPLCCDGQVASSYESVLMCKQDASGEQSSVIVKRSEVGMIDTMKEMEYLTCQ